MTTRFWFCAVAVVLGTALAGCSNGDAAFCEAFEGQQSLEGLLAAVTAPEIDTEEVNRELAEFEDLADAAPAEIAMDMELVADAVESVVRIVTGVSEDGGALPDEDEVNAELTSVTNHSQRVLDWVAANCA